MKKRLILAGKILLGSAAVWLVGDFVHSRLVAHWIHKWEATVEREPSGVLIGCEAYSVGEGDGVRKRKTGLLLVHGINASPRHYEKMAPALAAKGFACRVMRLPGFAEPMDRYAKSSREDWLAAVDEELKTLRAKYDRIGIVAHSLGGAVATGQLINHPDSVDFAVLLAPAVKVSSHRAPVLSTRTWHDFGKRAFFSTRILRSPYEIDCHDPAHLNHPGRSPFTSIAMIDSLYQQMDSNRQRAEEFRTPLLMVLSEQDIIVDTPAAKQFYQQVSSTKKELRMLDNSGHCIPLDYDWEKTANAIGEFAERLAGE